MTGEPTTPIRWIEGHLVQLDDRAAGAEHARRAALAPADQRRWIEELDDIARVRAEWHEVLRRVAAGRPAQQKRKRR